MRRILQSLAVAVAVAVAVAGCATTQVAPEKAAAIKTIGLVSALGDEVRLQHVGLTVFSNDLHSTKLDWQLDRHVLDRLAQHIGTRYQVRPVSYDKAPLLKASTKEWIHTDRPTLAEALRATVPAGVVDAFVVVVPTYMGDTAYGTNQHVYGVGAYTRGVFSERSRANAFAAYRIALIDGKTFTSLADTAALIPSTGRWIGEDVPFRPIPSAGLKNRLDDMRREDLATLRDAVVGLLDASIPYTLKKMKLID